MTVALRSTLQAAQRPRRSDLALAVSLVVVALLSGRYIDAGRPDTVEPSSWWHWVLICVPAALVGIRRIDPAAVVAIGTVAQVAIWVSNLPEVLLPIIVLLFTASSDAGHRGKWTAIAASAVLSAVTAIGVVVADDVTPYQLPLVVLTCGTAIALGLQAKRQRTDASELAGRVATAELRAEHERAEAIARERAHIGRELHDIIGHSLSTIAVRAEAADRVADNKPDAARAAVADIAVAARTALTETRRVLGGLQRASDAELAPPPDLDAICRMVADLAASGVDVALATDGCERDRPSAVVAGGAFRIVQESLTNAIKHGGPATTIAVGLRWSVDGVDMRITNTIDGQTSLGSRTASGGSGLAGMAERARVLGGTFATTATADRFEVTASLPHRATDSTPTNGTTR